jgi:hypothetical protein
LRRPLSIALTHALPTVVLLLVAVWPLLRGDRTLYLRDAANTHLPAKWAQAEAMREGRLPLVDPLRDGGQPALGNPNTVPLYPDNLLYLVAPTLWAFNAHFWLHLLLAPAALYWLARAWGLGRRAAWAAGACYAASGFFLSALNLYNLVAGYAVAPAMVAAALRFEETGRRPLLAALAVLWALMLLAGDPMTAAVALGAALLAVITRAGWRAAARGRLWGALGLGTLVAAPQLVEFLRILPASFRGHWGYSAAAAAEASWHPATIIDWLVPLPFGGPDLAFWGRPLFGGELPLLFSLYPGVAALALALAAGGPGRGAAGAARRWAWGLVVLGVFLALGGYNPVMRGLMALPGAGLLRLPVKFWLLVALGAAMLCGQGFERSFGGERRPLALALGGVAAVLAFCWLGLTLVPSAAHALMAALSPGAAGALLDGERLRWAGLCLLGLLLVAVCAGLLRLARRHPATAGALLICAHVASQLFLLRPLLESDEAALYRQPAELLEIVPPSARSVHGVPDNLFGAVKVVASAYPDPRLIWYQQQTRQQLFPAAGRLWGRRYELTRSPEGLDSFLSRATAQTLPGLDDVKRLRLLAASGVDHLLLARPLAPAAAAGVELLERRRGESGDLFVYRLAGERPEAFFAGSVRRAPHLNAALSLILDPSFDPFTEAVLPGSGRSTTGTGGRVDVVASGPESLQLRVEAPGAGALVVHRAHLPIWRHSRGDGRPDGPRCSAPACRRLVRSPGSGASADTPLPGLSVDAARPRTPAAQSAGCQPRRDPAGRAGRRGSPDRRRRLCRELPARRGIGRAGAADRRRRGASGLRLSGRERRVRRHVRERWSHFHRPTGRGDGGHGIEDREPPPDARRRRAGGARW